MYFSDYKEVGGILLAHTERHIIAGQEQILRMETVEHNAQIPSSRFNLPPEVQALVDRQERREKGTQKEE
jgi:hypothetical protein